MASTYWLKLYHEMLDDPKVCRLSDRLYRRTIEMFLLAGDTGNGGYIPDPIDIAWRLRVDEAELVSEMEQLRDIGILSNTPDGWLVTNFEKRQNAVSDAERQKRYRERKHKATYYGNDSVTTPVTIRNTDIDIDIDIDKDVDNAPPPTSTNQSGSSYVSQVFSGVTGMIAIPGSELDRVIPVITDLRVKYPREPDLIDYLKPYYSAWVKRKTKDGRSYSKTNCTWLYDWAVTGEIPQEARKQPADTFVASEEF